MDSVERCARVESILLIALDLDETKRDAYLEEACCGDSILRNEVESLLQETDASTEFFAPDVLALGGPTSDSGFATGAVIAGRFRIDEYLAAGGMGRVYRAHDLELDFPMALKTIQPEIASNPVFLRLFKQEVLLARSISHPNVCRIFDLWRDEPTGVSFLTMEFLAGETLARRIKDRGAFSTEVTLPLARQMAEALDAAHRAGIVHRDFKSPNVMVVPNGNGGRAVITDFGLAVTVESGEKKGPRPRNTANRDTDGSDTDPTKLDNITLALDETEALEASGISGSMSSGIVGTPAYMSPEQVSGGSIGPASDIYSLGVVLFEMCTGKLPFHGLSLLETARSHLTVQPPNPSTLTTISEEWEKAILRLLAKKPSERYTTAHDAILALEGRSDEGQTVRHSLPAERDAFVGRNDELRTMAKHLESEEENTSRLFTLLGTGGTGKTRLAQKYGWDSLLRWPGGVWFCQVSEARTAIGVTSAVATSLGVPLGRQDPVVQLGNAIAGRGPCLIVLDNFEQVVEFAADTVGRWIERAPAARFLVTSRQRLQLATETVHELEPLDPMTRGMELFEVRAWGHRPGFMVDPSNQKQIQEIVKKLDGLPLAIEMAASRLRVLSPSQLQTGLADRFRILAGAKEGRHATMQATMDWSWDLLNAREQSVISQVSVFEGGFDLEAAEAVVDLSEYDEDPLSVLDVIQSLVDKSWLRAKAALGAPRFEMYSTVQEYASVRLSDPAKAETRHSTHYAEMGTSESIESLDRHGGVAKRTALHLELDNLVAGCRRALARRNEETAAGTFRAAEAALRSRGPYVLCLELGREVLEAVKEPARRAHVLTALAGTALLSGEMKESHESFEKALTTFRELGDRHFEGRVLANLATQLRIQGRLEEAHVRYEVALTIQREEGDRHGEAIVLGNLGNFHHEQGRTEEALELYGAALAINLDVGDRISEAMMRSNLGLVHMGEGRMELAREYFETALAIHREVGNRRSEGLVLGNLGNLHMDQGRLEETREHYEAALAINRELGDRRNEGVVAGNLGLLFLEQGQMEAALEQFEAALAIHRAVLNRRFEGIVLGWLGSLHLDLSRIDTAHEHLESALAIHREVGNRGYEGEVLNAFGHLHAKLGRTKEARDCYDEGLSILRDMNDPLMVAKSLCNFGEFEIREGHVDAARLALVEAESIEAELVLGSESELAGRIQRLQRSLAET